MEEGECGDDEDRTPLQIDRQALDDLVAVKARRAAEEAARDR